MEGRSAEFLKPIPENTDKGFSEKRAARVIEGKHADNSQIKKRKLFVSTRQKTGSSRIRIIQKGKTLTRAARTEKSLKEKIFVAYEKNSEEIQKLMRNFSVLSQGSFSATEQLMIEMRARQHLQEELLNALAFAGRGELTEDTLSKELADLIK